jgi:hypothetical protein
MKHLLIEQTAKGVTVKCGATIKNRTDATVWYSDVDCTKCRPYRFMPVPADDPIGGMKMVYVGDAEEAPVVKSKRRIIRNPSA